MRSIRLKAARMFLRTFFCLALAAALPAIAHCGAAAGKGAIRWRAGDLSSLCALAAREGKDVLIYMYADGCFPCEKMLNHIFTNRAAANAVNSFFIPAAAEKKSDFGKQLAERYRAPSTPVCLVLSSGGNEIDRLRGARSPEAFLREITDIHENKNTLADHLLRLKRNPNDPDALYRAFQEYVERADSAGARETAGRIERADGAFYRAREVEILSGLQKAAYDGRRYLEAVAYARRLLEGFPGTDARRLRFSIAFSYGKAGEWGKAYEAFTAMLDLYPGDASIYYKILQVAEESGHLRNEALTLALNRYERGGKTEENAELAYRIARLYRKMGLPDAARRFDRERLDKFQPNE